MNQYLIIIPVVFILVALVYTVVQHLVRAWLDHRVKIALLEKLENKPEMLRSFNELQDLLDSTPREAEKRSRQDLTITGVVLAIIGALCVLIYGNIGSGRWAVGAYWGGVACVAIGFILALLGLLIRYLDRGPK